MKQECYGAIGPIWCTLTPCDRRSWQASMPSSSRCTITTYRVSIFVMTCLVKWCKYLWNFQRYHIRPDFLAQLHIPVIPFFAAYLYPPAQWCYEYEDRVLYALQLWPKKEFLPSTKRTSSKVFHLGKRCPRCALYGHTAEDCPDCTEDTLCIYPFCRHHGHLPPACPTLYGKCGTCGLRGHSPRHHAW